MSQSLLLFHGASTLQETGSLKRNASMNAEGASCGEARVLADSLRGKRQ